MRATDARIGAWHGWPSTFLFLLPAQLEGWHHWHQTVTRQRLSTNDFSRGPKNVGSIGQLTQDSQIATSATICDLRPSPDQPNRIRLPPCFKSMGSARNRQPIAGASHPCKGRRILPAGKGMTNNCTESNYRYKALSSDKTALGRTVYLEYDSGAGSRRPASVQ